MVSALLEPRLVPLCTPQGSFCTEFGQDHFRTITLPPMETLEEAYDRLERFLKHHAS